MNNSLRELFKEIVKHMRVLWSATPEGREYLAKCYAALAATQDDAKDAERYRWLVESGSGSCFAPFSFIEIGCSKSEIDTTIDAAIAAQSQTKAT